MFIVIELQTSNGTTANIVNSYDDRSDAESKYHSVLSAAAKSNIDIHSAIMLDEKGILLKSEYYTH